MAPLKPVPNVLRIRLLFTIGGKPNQGIRFFSRWSGSTPSASSLTTLCGQIAVAAVTHLIPLIHPSTSLTEVIIEDLTSSTAATGSASGVNAGTRTGAQLPADVAFVSSYEIARRYRGGHPRSYLPFGVDTDLTTSQLWKLTAVTDFVAGLEAFFATVGTSSAGGTTIGAHVAISYFKGFTIRTRVPYRPQVLNTPRTTPLVTDVTSIAGRRGVGSFRKRRFKNAA